MDKTALKKLYFSRGIVKCELKYENCWRDNTLSFAHRHKRRWYLSHKDLLWTFNQTILACNSCHHQIEYDSDRSEKEFQRLRGDEVE